MKAPRSEQLRFFDGPAELRAWFAANHETAAELWAGYYRRETGIPSITWPESVDEALCVGWIDGIRHRVDDQRYCIRFTPRRPGSRWSKVNLSRYEVLADAGLVLAAGRAAWERRIAADDAYSYERDEIAFSAAQQERFAARASAWVYFENQPLGYRRRVTHWITSAKRTDTQDRRLAKLIEACERGERLF